MIPLLSRLLSKSKQRWLAQQDAKLQEEFAPQLAAAQAARDMKLQEVQQQSTVLQGKYAELQRVEAQLESQGAILADRQVTLQKANEELRTQLRLIEAKAAPDRVWVEAFSRGYQTAWDTIWPIMSQGVLATRELIAQKAIDETLTRLDSLVVERATALGILEPQMRQELVKKQEEFQQRLTETVTDVDRAKYQHYLTALEWMLHANGVHTHQPTA